MFSRLKSLYCLLSPEQRNGLLRLQFLIVVASFAEIVGVVSIGPFMAVVADVSHLYGQGLLAKLYQASGFTNPTDFLFWLGVAVLLLLTFATSITMITTWRSALYSQQVGAELSTRLYKYYMQQPWLFHASGSSSQLTSKIAQECNRVTNLVIAPLMQMNAKVVMALLMATAIVIFDPLIALVGLVVFVGAYALLYRIVRRRLTLNGQTVSKMNQSRFTLMNEGFGGIKDTLLLGRQAEFNQQFERASYALGNAMGKTQAMALVPRYAMELVAFGAVIFLVLYLLAYHQGDLGSILPVLSVYALAGFKLLPALQQIYISVTKIRAHLSAFDSLYVDLSASKDAKTGDSSEDAGQIKALKEIRFDNVVFHYPSKDQPALNGLNMTVPVNKVIGLVGKSGSGKSTAIDVILGLIDPEEGAILIDEQPLTLVKKRAWQNSLGFVPQSIFLADASIRENIAFGLPLERIDDARLKHAVQMAHLVNLVNSLPDGLDTRVGERGVQLSGGQRQRIGIARALYNDADVLVLDEATSALDGITEKMVIEAIHDFSGKKTIIMIAHRLSTVKPCDVIYMMEAGKVVDSGTYDELIQRNKVFQHMAQHP